MTFDDAQAKCEADGASIPVPLTSFEDDFYTSRFPDDMIYWNDKERHNGLNNVVCVYKVPGKTMSDVIEYFLKRVSTIL